MNCEEFKSLLPSSPDALGSEADNAALLSHAAACEACARRLSEHETLLATLSTLDDGLEIPEAFSTGWRAMVHAEAESGVRTKSLTRRRGARGVWTIAAAFLVIVAGTAMMRGGLLFPSKQPSEEPLVFSADEGGSLPAPESEPLMYAAMMMEEAAGGAADRYAEPAAEKEMSPILLHSATISLRSEQYDADISAIDSLLRRTGGWSESWSIAGESLRNNPSAGRHAAMTLRIPMHTLDSFVSDVSAIGKLLSCAKYVDDISERYYDVQGRLSMYEAQRDRLSAMLATTQTLSEILEIQEKLDDVQYAMESLVSQLNSWNSLAGNAVVHVSIEEVAPGGDSARAPLIPMVKDALSRSLSAARAFALDMLVFLIMAAPYLLAGIIALAVLLALARVGRRRKNKKDPQKTRTQEE